MAHIIIIGAGVSGLTAAYRLAKLQPDATITVLESSQRIGGNIVTERFAHAGGEFLIEGAADSFLARKARGVALCEELGLAEQLIGRDARFERTYVKFGGKLHPLPAGLTGMIPTNLQAMDSSTLLSAAGKARLAQEVNLPAQAGDDDESLASFVTRRLGQEAYERMVEPLMSGIYAGDGAQLSLAATFPQLRQLEKEHGSLITGLLASTGNQPAANLPAKYPPFIALRDGTGQLIAALAERVGLQRIYTGVAAKSITRSKTGAGFAITLSDGSSMQSDALILATPAYVTAQLVQSIDPTLSQLHEEILYSSTATVTLAFQTEKVDPHFNGYGYVVPRSEDADVLACSWMSNKWAGRAPVGYQLARVYIGRFGRSLAEEASDDQLVQLAVDELRNTLDITSRAEFRRSYRWLRSMPQYMVGHLERVAMIEQQIAQIEGLALAGAAYRGVGIPDCIGSGEAAAKQIAQFFTRQDQYESLAV